MQLRLELWCSSLQTRCSMLMLCFLLQEICHRDLKLENTLLDGNPSPRLKICDFGYSKVNSISHKISLSEDIFGAFVSFFNFFCSFLFNLIFNCSLLYCTLNLSQQLELLHTLLQRFCHERSMTERYLVCVWIFITFTKKYFY